MKKIIYLIFLALILVSCEKIFDNQDFVGEWTAEQDSDSLKFMNVFYSGYFKDSVRASRRITYGDTISIVISDAPYKVIGGYVNDGALYYNEYQTENHPTTPNCGKLTIRYYNVKAQLYDNTLLETGSYNVFEEGVGWDRGINTYYAKFVRRK